MFNQKPFRIPPAGPAHAYQTFQIHTPRGPEFDRPATCEEIDCEAWRLGWVTRVPAANIDLIEAVAKSGRTYTDLTPDGAAEREFMFGPGQPCFRASQHRVPVRPDLPQTFLVKDGDWRGNPRGTQPRIHTRPEDWVEHAHEVTDAVQARIERG